MASDRGARASATTPAGEALDWIEGELADLARQSLLRSRCAHDGLQAAEISIAGRRLVSFGSNDYLGLAADPRPAATARAALDHTGSGAGASPLVTGYAAPHALLERALAELEGSEAALVFSSGYAANVGAITALVGESDAIYSDRKNHASMIDGCRLSRARVHVYPHCDATALAEQLAATAHQARRRLIVTESVFSMDGDLAPLAELADLAERYECMLLVDEAHATGVFGASGRGLGEALGLDDRIHVRIGTLSKALGCAGGFVSGSSALIQWLVNRARSYVFSTALPPATCVAALTAVQLAAAMTAERKRLLASAEQLREQLRDQGWQLGASQSQIIPILLGEPERAVTLSRQLLAAGLLVPAIRPPSVPAGESLLRISLTCGHSDEMLGQLVAELEPLRR